MLRRFAVTNFRGFKDKIELNLSNPNNYEFNRFAIKDGLVKDAIIYGPNGSGKSNMGLALFDVVNHLTQKNKLPDYYKNVTYGKNNELVQFEYEFQFGEKIVEYDYSKTSDGVIKEEKFVVDGIVYFDRKMLSVYFNSSFFSIQPSISDDIVQSANNFSVVSYLLSSYPLSTNSPLILLNDFVNRMLWFRCLEERKYIGLENGITYIDEYIISNNKVEDYRNFILGISGQDFVFKKPNEGDKVLICIIDGKELPFHEISSTGTHSLSLLYYWFSKIENTSLVFIDEFDAFYHYELSYEICKRLFELNNQILLTSHNTSLLTNDLLRPDCYFLINGKEIKPFAECTNKDLRIGHNLEKIYRGKGCDI